MRTIIWVTRASDERLLKALARGRKRARAPYLGRSWGGRYRVAADCWETCGRRARIDSVYCDECGETERDEGRAVWCELCGWESARDSAVWSVCNHLGLVGGWGMVGVGDRNQGDEAHLVELLRKAVGVDACQELAAACRQQRDVARDLWALGRTMHPFTADAAAKWKGLWDEADEDKLVIVATACAAPDDVFERVMRLLEAP